MRWDQQRSNPGLIPLPVQDPVNYALRKCTDGVIYWMPAFACRAQPGSLGRNDRNDVSARRAKCGHASQMR